MPKMTKFQKLKQIAEDNGWSFREDYSGRWMFGKTCAGIVTDDPYECVSQAKRKKIQGHVTDNMGLSTIVYWPHIQTEEKSE